MRILQRGSSPVGLGLRCRLLLTYLIVFQASTDLSPFTIEHCKRLSLERDIAAAILVTIFSSSMIKDDQLILVIKLVQGCATELKNISRHVLSPPHPQIETLPENPNTSLWYH
jgi:hypothetical protein